MGQRIFIAINLPENIKKKLAQYQDKWPDLPCRWTKKENLHITLEFLGYLTDEEVVEACQRAEKMALAEESFSINLNKIGYGPGNNKPAKMVWATGEKLKEFNLRPHITLGRIKTWQFKQLNPEERPQIDEDIDLNFEVTSIEVMESQLSKGGAKYNILQSCPLKD
jgi:2'-5' RNA ligase